MVFYFDKNETTHKLYYKTKNNGLKAYSLEFKNINIKEGCN